jgi:hypothetical protein
LQDHPKDAEFLNQPLANYIQMQAIFGSGVATGRFAMGSNEPLGEPTDAEPIDVDQYEPVLMEATAEELDRKAKALGKKKRQITEDEGGSLRGLTEAVWGFCRGSNSLHKLRGHSRNHESCNGVHQLQQGTTDVLSGSPDGAQEVCPGVHGHGR